FQQVGTRRRLPRPVQVDKLPVVFAASASGSSLRGRCHDAPPLRLPLVPRWPGVFLHSVRGLLHECTWLCLGHTRGNQGSGTVSRRNGGPVFIELRSPGGRPL